MRLGVLTLAIVCVFLSGCYERKLQVPYDQAEYDRLATSGTGVVEGQAFLLTAGGDVKKGAGKPVSLVPVTSASTEIHQIEKVRNQVVTGWDDRMKKNTRVVQADADGRFRFTDVPPGDYYVYCWISWLWWNSGVESETGGWAYATVRVRDGETVRAIATRP